MVTRGTRMVVVGLCLLALGVSVPTAQADEAFARVTGTVQGAILGDQADIKGIVGSKDAIQVFSTGFGLSRAPGLPGGPLGSPVAAPLTLLKLFDRASPRLLRAAFTGERLSVEIIWFMTIGTAVRQTVSVRLDDAIIRGIEASASLQGNSASNFEQVTLVYSRITIVVPTIDSTGKVTGTTTVCLDVAGNLVC